MHLEAQLTTGWQDDPQDRAAAIQLHQTASQSNADYSEALNKALQSEANNARILGLEQLFRKRSGGFESIKQFVGALASIAKPEQHSEPLVCHIDVFAYAFLKGAKNFDFLLPPSPTENAGFAATRDAWSRTLSALENFERLGTPLPADSGVTADQYRAIRGIVTRSSARDERRALATLLVSGPSTLADISTDLGQNYTLGQRTLAAFEQTGAVERRVGDSPTEPVFVIAESALPLVVFCVRETMGLDLLSTFALED